MSKFQSRYFNQLFDRGDHIEKISTRKDELYAEYCVYEALPDSLMPYYARPFDYKTDSKNSAYKVSKIDARDLSETWVQQSQSTSDFFNFIMLLKSYFMLAKRASEPTQDSIRPLYLDKMNERLSMLKKYEKALQLDLWIKDNTPYKSIDDLAEHHTKIYLTYESKDILSNDWVISHGDMVLSNIFIQKNSLLLIDPRGVHPQYGLYLPRSYDYVKLTQSILGYYDFITKGLYEIRGRKISYTTSNPTLLQNLQGQYNDFIIDSNFSIKELRLLESILRISLLPFHIEDFEKLKAFTLQSVDFIESL